MNNNNNNGECLCGATAVAQITGHSPFAGVEFGNVRIVRHRNENNVGVEIREGARTFDRPEQEG